MASQTPACAGLDSPLPQPPWGCPQGFAADTETGAGMCAPRASLQAVPKSSRVAGEGGSENVLVPLPQPCCAFSSARCCRSVNLWCLQLASRIKPLWAPGSGGAQARSLFLLVLQSCCILFHDCRVNPCSRWLAASCPGRGTLAMDPSRCCWGHMGCNVCCCPLPPCTLSERWVFKPN